MTRAPTTSGPRQPAAAPGAASPGLLRRAATEAAGIAAVPRIVQTVVDSAGAPLDPTSRALMERRVFYDPRGLRADEVAAASRWAAERAYSQPRGRVHYTSEGEERVKEEIRDALLRQRLSALRAQASDADRALSLKAAAQIHAATAGVAGLTKRAMGPREDDPATASAVEQAAREAHPTVAGNIGRTGALDTAFWSGSGSGGISLGGYAPPRGMSVFTVEPAINRNIGDYPSGEDPTVTVDDRRIELQSYADAVRTVLLGRP